MIPALPRYLPWVAGLAGGAVGFGLIQVLLVLAGQSGLPLWLPIAVLVLGVAGWSWCSWQSSYRARLWRFRRGANR